MISTEPLESVAAELALVVQLEDEKGLGRARKTDLGVTRSVLGANAGSDPVGSKLQNLANSCTRSGTGMQSPDVAFAAIGMVPETHMEGDAVPSLEFYWTSGDAEWGLAIQKEPFASIWRRALEERRVIGSAPPSAWTQSAVARILAIPLESEGAVLGVLVAGISNRSTSLATLERLELRAALAADLLRHRKTLTRGSRLLEWQRELVSHSKEPLFLLDDSGKILALSDTARDLASRTSGFEPARPPEVQAGSYFPLLFRARHREATEAWLRSAATSKSTASGETDGEMIAELRNGLEVRLRLAASRMGKAAAVAVELTAAAESASDGGRAETELQSVIEWLEEGVVLFDAKENVRAMNTRFQHIAGLAPAESETLKTLDALIRRLEGQAAEPQKFAERWRQLARGMEGGVREEVKLAQPAARILERAARPVLDSIGRQLGRVEIYRDLTAQRVFQSKLLQTEKLAALGQMVSGIAHELSNPLTSILGNAQRMLSRPENAGSLEEARRIFQEAERASTILRQLLLNARDTLPERRLISLNQVVLRAMEVQRFSLAAEKIHIELDLDPVLPFVHGDPGHLQQVLMNLLGNAQQAIESQGTGGKIVLRTRRAGEHDVLLEVEDDGPGIPQAILPRIFDPFFTTKPAGVGTGLGLAIVLSVVREHGGQVHVVTPAQGGTKFQITLPAAAEAPKEALKEGPKQREIAVFPESFSPKRHGLTLHSGGCEDLDTTAPETWKGCRVMVVEDEPTVARLIADVLEDEAMKVDVILDGREALDRAARADYDLVICDMKMPGLDGQKFYKSLVRTANPLRDRFLFVTGDIVAAQTREFLERNHLPHVAKPFRVEELMEKVYGVLGNKMPHRPAPPGAERQNAARNG
jgi:signal transduction histidine kinase/ActR/RegA family two-component response regulator